MFSMGVSSFVQFRFFEDSVHVSDEVVRCSRSQTVAFRQNSVYVCEKLSGMYFSRTLAEGGRIMKLLYLFYYCSLLTRNAAMKGSEEYV